MHVARALVAGVLPVIEVTLRTALSMRFAAIAAEVQDATAGAGTMLSVEQAHQAV